MDPVCTDIEPEEEPMPLTDILIADDTEAVSVGEEAYPLVAFTGIPARGRPCQVTSCPI